MQEIKKKIGKACVQLLIRHPFFGSLVYQHDYLVSREVPTAGVTPEGLMLFNPDFVETCSREELMFLVAHEVMHVVFAHALRRGHRDHELYNIACDAVINEILVAEGVGKFIDGGIRMKGAEARTSESIYEELAGRIKKPKKATAPGLAGLDLASGTCSADNDGNGKGGSNNGDNNKNSDKNEQSYSGTLSIKDLPENVPPITQEQISEQISMGKISLGQAASLARSRGLMSGMLGRFVDQALESKMPWHQLLERYLLSKADQRYTWSRPDKRRLNIAYLPRRERVPSMGEVVLPQDMRLVVEAIIEVGQLRLQPPYQLGSVDIGAGRNGERQDNAGKRGMNARLEQTKPQHETERHVRREPEVPTPVEHRQRQRDGSGCKKPDRARGMPVEERDGKNGKEVVCDGER